MVQRCKHFRRTEFNHMPVDVQLNNFLVDRPNLKIVSAQMFNCDYSNVCAEEHLFVVFEFEETQHE